MVIVINCFSYSCLYSSNTTFGTFVFEPNAETGANLNFEVTQKQFKDRLNQKFKQIAKEKMDSY
jgi:hypothetical protein